MKETVCDHPSEQQQQRMKPDGLSRVAALLVEKAEWDTPHVHDTVHDLSLDSGTTALGLLSAPVSTSTRGPGSRCEPAIVSVDDASTEMVLTRQCADMSKHMYHMRINGDLLDHDLLAAFDGQMLASVSASLSGNLPDHSWWQAITDVICGGLASARRLGSRFPPSWPAASLCRTVVSTMIDHFSLAFAPRASPSWTSTTRALTKPLRALSPPSRRTQGNSRWDSSLAERELLWHAGPALSISQARSRHHSRDGDGDDEHPLARKRLKIQALITTCVSIRGCFSFLWSSGLWCAGVPASRGPCCL